MNQKLTHVPETLLFFKEILYSSKIKIGFVTITTCVGILQTQNKWTNICVCVYAYICIYTHIHVYN